MKFDQKKIIDRAKNIISQFNKDAWLFLILLLVILVLGSSKMLAPKFSDMVENINKFNQKKESAKNMQKKMKMKQQFQYKKVVKESKLPVQIYKVPFKGSDLESSAVGLINQVIYTIKKSEQNKIL